MQFEIFINKRWNVTFRSESVVNNNSILEQMQLEWKESFVTITTWAMERFVIWFVISFKVFLKKQHFKNSTFGTLKVGSARGTTIASMKFMKLLIKKSRTLELYFKHYNPYSVAIQLIFLFNFGLRSFSFSWATFWNWIYSFESSFNVLP